jgi:ribulose-5-phosphate 4-epimerase/fuculose-1-phosphate aldolase
MSDNPEFLITLSHNKTNEKHVTLAFIVLMRGHGSTVVGNSIEQVVYRAIYAEVNAKLQAQSLGMGTVNYLTEGEAELAAAVNDSQIARSWNLWQRRIGTIEA